LETRLFASGPARVIFRSEKKHMGNVLLLLLLGGAAFVVANNYQRCVLGGTFYSSLNCANGQVPVPGPSSAPGYGICAPATGAQLLPCLFNLSLGNNAGFDLA
jgi:hypothetical protein